MKFLSTQTSAGQAGPKFISVCQRIWKNNSRDFKKIWLATLNKISYLLYIIGTIFSFWVFMPKKVPFLHKCWAPADLNLWKIFWDLIDQREKNLIMLHAYQLLIHTSNNLIWKIYMKWGAWILPQQRCEIDTRVSLMHLLIHSVISTTMHLLFWSQKTTNSCSLEWGSQCVCYLLT